MKNSQIIKQLKEGKYDELLASLYEDASLVDHHRDRYVKALERYQQLYGDDEVQILSVGGRSEVGGNHTDHQHGKVIACAINLDIIGIVKPSANVLIDSDGRKVAFKGECIEYVRKEEKTTMALVKGVMKGLANNGHNIGGFTAYLTSDVLVGSGMSSSAAFETMIGNIINYLYNDGQISDVEIAKVGQYAENVYFGKPSGLMDQMACSVGNLINIDFKDNENPLIERVDVDFSKSGYSLCIIDTKGSHAKLTDEYASIPNEMRLVAAYFGKQYIREITLDQVLDNIDEVRKNCGDRAVLRAIHVLEENDRVDQEVAALNSGNFDQFLATVQESGNSSYKYLQNVYANRDFNNQSVSLGICISEMLLKDGKGVVRVHGGGFAGSIQAFVRNENVEEYKTGIEKVFGPNSCHILKVRSRGGFQVIK